MSILSNFLDKRSQNNPDGEMGFVDHLEALRWHILRALAGVFIAAIAVYLNIKYIFDEIILGPTRENFISYQFLCAIGQRFNIENICLQEHVIRFQNIKLTGQFMMGLSSAVMIGFIAAFPYVLWELWRFVKPALKKKELKHARGMVFWGALLFITGVLFSYFVIVPFTYTFFSSYMLSDQFENIFTIADYYSTLTTLVLGAGLIFEFPMLVYFFSKIGLLTPGFLRSSRRYAIMIILIVSAVITPPDIFSLALMCVPLYGLYEVSIIISARIEKKREREEGIIKDLDW